MRFMITLIFCLFFFCSESQDSISVSDKVIKALHDWRGEFTSDTIRIEKFNTLLDKYLEIEEDRGDVFDFFSQVKLEAQFYREDFEKLKDVLDDPDVQKLVNVLTEEDVQIMREHWYFIDIIYKNWVWSKYPFEVKERDSCSLYKELDFYNLQEEDIIVDIGAGFGTLGALLLKANFTDYIYMTETNSLKRAVMKRINKAYFTNGPALKIVKGKKKSVNIKVKADKIIVRNSFHHFKKKEKMLKSIKSIMDAGTELLIYERIITAEDPNPTGCKLYMDHDLILQYFEDAGFSLKEEVLDDTVVYLKYTL